MAKVTIAELDQLADEMLQKSEKPAPVEEPKPEEISEEGAVSSPDEKEKPEEKPAPAPAEEPEKEEPEPEEEPEEKPEKEELEKSISNEFTAVESVAKSMEASEFLSAVVEILTKSLADVHYELQAGADTAQQSTTVLVKSLKASLELNKSLRTELSESSTLLKSVMGSLDELRGMVSDVLAQPVAVRKSVSNIQVMDKDFNRSLSGNASNAIDTLSKSQIMDVLSSELYKGNPSVSTQDIISYESGAPLRPELVTLVTNHR